MTTGYQGMEVAPRASSPGLEELLGIPFRVGEEGSVTVVDYMGNDRTPAQAARVSYGAEGKTKEEDAGLVRYLLKNRHTSPFEMCRIRLNVRMPIFVARQWIRHRQSSLNEISLRYVSPERGRDLPHQKDYFLPQESDLAGPPDPGQSKQGRSVKPFAGADAVLRKIQGFQAEAHRLYEELAQGTSEHDPVARELARIILPVGTMTKWTWASDLHNLLHFLTLRLDPHAQGEIREYAKVISWIVSKWVPMCWDAWASDRLHNRKDGDITQNRLQFRTIYTIPEVLQQVNS